MGKVIFEFDENEEREDIELIVNRLKMSCALDELKEYRDDLYKGYRDHEMVFIRDGKVIETGENKNLEDVKNTKSYIEVSDVLNILDNILEDVKHLI